MNGMNSNIQLGRRQVVQGAAVVGVAGAAGLWSASSASAATTSGVRSAAAATTTVSSPVLRVGSTGSAVRDLQNRLNASSFWCGTADGSFGSLTQQAVYAVQKFHGLSRDGICGPITWGAVRSGQRPRARYGTGYRIEVDKSRQLLLVAWGTSVAITLNTSTGFNKPFESNGHWYNGQTPSGTFKVWYVYPGGWQNGTLGLMYRPYYFNGSIAIHGSTSIPPYNASHGCCRVSTAAQDLMIARKYLYPQRQVIVY